MSEKLDNFSRNLASGMTRRKAAWQLVAGVGGLGLLTTTKAKADAAGCSAFCFQQASVAYTDAIEDDLEAGVPFIAALTDALTFYGEILNACVAFSASLCTKPGQCATVNYTVAPGEIDITNATCVTI